jgi:hypothetical protein
MGHLLKTKCVDSRVNVNILALTSVQFTPSMVQVPNLALTLTHTKRITVHSLYEATNIVYAHRKNFLLCEAYRNWLLKFFHYINCLKKEPEKFL